MPVPPLVAKLSAAVPWDIYALRASLLFISLIYVLASSSPALEFLTAPLASQPSPQYDLFLTDCQRLCVPSACANDCAQFCNATVSPYYKQMWPELASICDDKCSASSKLLCAGTQICPKVCREQADALRELRGVSNAQATRTSIRVLAYLGPTFWSTLLLVPLAAADILISFIHIGPLLRATEEEIYNNRYSLYSKVVKVIESPRHFFMAATVAFEVKCLMFDDSDGFGLGITVVLQLVAFIARIVPVIKQKIFNRAENNDPVEVVKAEQAASRPPVTPAPVAASPRLSTPVAAASPAPLGQSI